MLLNSTSMVLSCQKPASLVAPRMVTPRTDFFAFPKVAFQISAISSHE